jgi:uncharacterized protein YcfJ
MTALKLTTSLIAGALLAASTGANAGPRYGDDLIVRAKVVAATPVYETINEPRRECWTETVGYETQSYRSDNNTGGAVLGAIAGGLLGSTVGKGSGKVAAAAAGAATGAVIGDRWNDGGRVVESRPQQIERCKTYDNFRQVVTGYDVRYRFLDREFSARLPYDPGEWLDLRVNFTIADRQRPERGDSYNRWGD